MLNHQCNSFDLHRSTGLHVCACHCAYSFPSNIRHTNTPVYIYIENKKASLWLQLAQLSAHTVLHPRTRTKRSSLSHGSGGSKGWIPLVKWWYGTFRWHDTAPPNVVDQGLNPLCKVRLILFYQSVSACCMTSTLETGIVLTRIKFLWYIH